MKFTNAQEMYGYLTTGRDLYNKLTRHYVFEYNDAHALCIYCLSREEMIDAAKRVIAQKEEVISAVLGTGGTIYDNPEYDHFRYSDNEGERKLYLKPSIEYCQEWYKSDDWISVEEFFTYAKIEQCMNDLMQKNSVCNYVIVQNEYERVLKNAYALDAYMETCKSARTGDAECYMSPLGAHDKAASPVFSVIDRKVTLGGKSIGHFFLNGQFETSEEQKERMFQIYKQDLIKTKETSKNIGLRFSVIEYVCSFPKIDPFVMAAHIAKDGITILYDDSSISQSENKAKERKVKQITI